MAIGLTTWKRLPTWFAATELFLSLGSSWRALHDSTRRHFGCSAVFIKKRRRQPVRDAIVATRKRP